MNNPRYTAKCVITREVGGGGYPPSAPETKTILRSVCGYRDETVAEISGGRIADYKIALPQYNVIVKQGDLIEVTDKRRTVKGTVKRDKPSNFGCNIWFNEVK
ncbi:hypothetical protein DXA95_12345 [Odoribacter sp. OF09-27XD]|jgi:hypothetical protein|nr:hypothetical protein [Odoribacter sp. OF09-27XD]RHV92588.1 hypothetical protein DXA95_12345 [Odoribacter sp. OF09-27XD]DAV89671.1 MAG TPA: hypothetical protein [Bacteriophage sp.]